MSEIRVLVVDDSAVFRDTFSKLLNAYDDIMVIGTACDAYEARDKIISLKPDVVTLDIEMPKMNGVDFLKKLIPQHPIPVVVCSSLPHNTFNALEAGAVDYVCKPTKLDSPDNLKAFGSTLAQSVRTAKSAKLIHAGNHNYTVKQTNFIDTEKHSFDRIIAIGGSTGATEALPVILQSMNIHTPPIVCTLHMPEGYTDLYAKRLNKQYKVVVTEAKSGMYLERGMVVIAAGNKHLKVFRDKTGYFVTSEPGPKVSGHCPSVDVLFESVALSAKDKAIGVILTGMGSDGADGMLAMKKMGAYNIGQNEESCLVYGMPKVAFSCGALSCQCHLEEIAYEIYMKLKEK